MRSRIALKRRIGRLYTSLRARDVHRKLILLYHSVGGGTESTTTEVFREQLGAIAKTAELVSLPGILGAAPDAGIAVAITFDDGYATLRDRAAAILADFDSAATVFLNAGEIGDDARQVSRPQDGYYPHEQFLTWRDVDALMAAGWQVGSHGVRHLDLTSVDAATAKDELCASKAQIERRLGRPCDMFAYPWGRNNADLRAEIRSAGYRYGFSGDHRSVTVKSDPFALPRINVAKEYLQDDLVAILRGDWDYLYWVAKTKAVMG